MTMLSSKIKVCLLALMTGLFLTAMPAMAQEQVSSKLKAYKVTVLPDKSEKLAIADKAKPGEILEYQLTYYNQGQAKVSKLQATLPIPPGTEYLMGSAKPAEAQASLDGKKFEVMPLKRTLNNADGKGKAVQVPFAEYRYLRWILPELPTGQSLVLKARVKVSAPESPQPKGSKKS
jgi:uncharacterized repeat protein (TIGR01451 family)